MLGVWVMGGLGGLSPPVRSFIAMELKQVIDRSDPLFPQSHAINKTHTDVILSAAKNLSLGKRQILRCAQNDRL